MDWPRPIGARLSIASTPVCSGCEMGARLLCATFGANTCDRKSGDGGASISSTELAPPHWPSTGANVRLPPASAAFSPSAAAGPSSCAANARPTRQKSTVPQPPPAKVTRLPGGGSTPIGGSSTRSSSSCRTTEPSNVGSSSPADDNAADQRDANDRASSESAASATPVSRDDAIVTARAPRATPTRPRANIDAWDGRCPRRWPVAASSRRPDTMACAENSTRRGPRSKNGIAVRRRRLPQHRRHLRR
eukprot:scaffold14228_cov101-Isochrysis_galbana.AAC.2